MCVDWYAVVGVRMRLPGVSVSYVSYTNSLFGFRLFFSYIDSFCSYMFALVSFLGVGRFLMNIVAFIALCCYVPCIR